MNGIHEDQEGQILVSKYEDINVAVTLELLQLSESQKIDPALKDYIANLNYYKNERLKDLMILIDAPEKMEFEEVRKILDDELGSLVEKKNNLERSNAL